MESNNLFTYVGERLSFYVWELIDEEKTVRFGTCANDEGRSFSSRKEQNINKKTFYWQLRLTTHACANTIFLRHSGSAKN